MALTDNKAKIQALIEGINALPEAGGSSETCMVTVDFPRCESPKYFVDGSAGFSYINSAGELKMEQITGVIHPVGVTSYTFDPVECKCGTAFSVATINGVQGFAKSSDEIGDPVMWSYANLMATFVLPETPGDYTITIYYSM